MDRLLGKFVDQLGNPVSGVEVTLQHVASRSEQSLRAQTDRLELGNLPVGDYRVTIKAPGFASVTDTLAVARGTGGAERVYVLKRVDERPAARRSTTKLEALTRATGEARKALQARGVRSAEDLVWAELQGVGAERLARELQIPAREAEELLAEARAQVPAEVVERMKRDSWERPKLGALDPRDPEALRRFSLLRELPPLRPPPKLPVPRLVARSVDLRPSMSPVTSQGGRGTCTSFGVTAMREFFENRRAGRGAAFDLSEEFNYWISRRLYNVGGDGWSSGGAAQNYVQVGGCSESAWPYDGKFFAGNISHNPPPNAALAGASWYRMKAVESLTAGDVQALKDCLAAGRVVTISASVFWSAWNGATGVLSLPAAGLASDGGHAICVVGWYEDAGAPGGGYFIFKNSWSRGWAWNNPLGDEYDGYGLMPYEYYKRHSYEAVTFADTGSEPAMQWQAQYFANVGLAGQPVLVQMVDAVQFNWAAGGPTPAMVDNFSARWTRVQRFDGGWYRFAATVDDGVRVWLDDRLLINDWRDGGARTIVKEFRVPAGDHVVRVEYYEHLGAARAELSCAPIVWRTEYFDNDALAGLPAAARDEQDMALEWRHVPPVGSDWIFSARSTATLQFEAGQHVFAVDATGGVRVKLDGVTVLDRWDSTGGSLTSAPTAVTAGAHQVTVEFRHGGGAGRAAVRLDWAENVWRTELYGNVSFDGAPKLRTDANLDFRWEAGSPDPAIASDNFSARFSRTVILPAGTYRFWAESDDGVRLVIDGRRVIDGWYDRGSVTDSCEVALEAGAHDVYVEYYDRAGGATCRVGWAGTSWRAEYYANREFSGTAVVRNDAAVRFDWGSGGPGLPGIGADNFAARWTKTVGLAPGRYRATLFARDGVRLRVDGRTLIDELHAGAAASYGCEFDVACGEATIVVEYAHATGDAAVRLELEPVGWLGEYYANKDLSGVPALFRVDGAIEFDWSEGAPAARLKRDQFSVRWRRRLQPLVGRYVLKTTVDDGIRVFVDGRAVIDRWTVTSPTDNQVTLDLVGRPHELVVEYFDQGGGALCQVSLERVN